MPRYFGTDGIRGPAGVFPLTPAALRVIGQALGSRAHLWTDPPQVIIGRDTRISGEWMLLALQEGLASVGLNVTDAGIIPTPGVAYLTKHAGFNLGIVISASHNPAADNGIKFFLPSGQKLAETDELVIEAALDRLIADSCTAAEPASLTTSVVTALPEMTLSVWQQRYWDFLRTQLAANLDLRGWKIAIDCAHGAATPFAARLLTALGAQVVMWGCAPDGQNINHQCGSLHLAGLQNLVRTTGCQLGIAFDGDADRTLLVDEQGEIVDGDRVLFILAKDLAAQGLLQPPCVVATVMSNLGLELALRTVGVELKRTAVGDKHVLAELLASQALLGGEQSGHLIFPKISLAGDGIVTALQVLQVLQRTMQPLSRLSCEFVSLPQVLINVEVKSKPAFTSVVAIKRAVAAVESALAGEGRLLLRYSGTENLARVMIEGRDPVLIHHQAEQLATVINGSLG
jgi:phosphoglucosamine mutase